jgi:hypothetical protein
MQSGTSRCGRRRLIGIRSIVGGLGVRRHRVDRPLDDPNYVIGELEFDTTAEAQACGVALRDLWSSAAAAPALVGAPQLRIVETVEDHSYRPELRREV